MEKVTIPEVGEIPMDHLSKFVGLLVEYVDLYRDISQRFDRARMIMIEGLDASNTMTAHAHLIDGCREVSDKVEMELKKNTFHEVVMLVDSIRR